MTKQTYQLRNEQILSNAINHLRNTPLNPDKPFIVTIQERTRSLEQNARLWATLSDISEQVNWHGRKLTTEQWKHIFTAALTKQDVVPNLAGDGFVVLGQSTSKMTVGELSNLIELINAFGAEQGVRFSEESRLAIEWANRWGESNKLKQVA